jgi:hypothetical protein
VFSYWQKVTFKGKQGNVLETHFFRCNDNSVIPPSNDPYVAPDTFLGWAVEGTVNIIDFDTFYLTDDIVFVPVLAEANDGVYYFVTDILPSPLGLYIVRNEEIIFFMLLDIIYINIDDTPVSLFNFVNFIWDILIETDNTGFGNSSYKINFMTNGLPIYLDVGQNNNENYAGTIYVKAPQLTYNFYAIRATDRG